MPTKNNKTPTKKTKRKTTKKASTTSNNDGIRPSVGIIFALAIALVVSIVFSVVSFNQLKSHNVDLANEKLALFDHLASRYVDEMEFTSNDKPTVKQMTGYGVSSEDGVFYITFDFFPYDVVDHNFVPNDDIRHGIMYFWEDKENNTYSHAYSYSDDASYHPDGVYIKVEENQQ